MTLTLTADTVLNQLRKRGILEPGTHGQVSMLAGGVSATTFRVVTPAGSYVVKQPLPFLAVANSWPAHQQRAAVEAAAIGRFQRLTPEFVPQLIDFDPVEYVLIISAAPPEWIDWRDVLLSGRADPAVCATLGRVLARWHADTQSDATSGTTFQSLSGFDELRGRPYYRAVAARRPDLAEPMLRCLDELVRCRICLVHGDYSPKNVLIGPSGLWVLDFEVTHVGNPLFDVAFMVHHLVMKAIHLDAISHTLMHCAKTFVGSYCSAGGFPIDENALVRHIGALLLARVHGNSVTTYLTPTEADRVSALGAAAIHRSRGTITELWPA